MSQIEPGQIHAKVLGRDRLVPRVLAEDERPDANAPEIIANHDAYFKAYWDSRADKLGCTFDIQPSVLDDVGNLWSRAVVRTVDGDAEAD